MKFKARGRANQFPSATRAARYALVNPQSIYKEGCKGISKVKYIKAFDAGKEGWPISVVESITFFSSSVAKQSSRGVDILNGPLDARMERGCKKVQVSFCR
ncbi:predicted protein [Coccidioides posadasii str. Silveira]|uniref:Predicted protein n=1 Tax=Coccidioides posadasii (strain RMSCC 757 / Silveira) TaxID=443226 RepID=E9D4Q5_COCPS|nr:predicted protein [Coccidioides posadasii str. Silveira]